MSDYNAARYELFKEIDRLLCNLEGIAIKTKFAPEVMQALESIKNSKALLEAILHE